MWFLKRFDAVTESEMAIAMAEVGDGFLTLQHVSTSCKLANLFTIT